MEGNRTARLPPQCVPPWVTGSEMSVCTWSGVAAQDDSQPPLPDHLLDQCMVEYTQYLCSAMSASIIAVVKAQASDAAGAGAGAGTA